MSITVEGLQEKCRGMFEQKVLVARLKAEKADQEKILAKQQDDVIECLEYLNLKAFDTGFGKVSRTTKPYAKIQDKDALTLFLKEKGDYDALVTYNAAKMNSYYNELLAIAKEDKNLNFNIPGMEMTSARKTLSITGVKL